MSPRHIFKETDMAITHEKEHVHSKDPITKAPDFHPVGTGLGAAAGGVAVGAAVGTVAGPVGTLVGAAAGAVVGGLAGKAAAHRIDSDLEDAYWEENYRSRPYVNANASYDDYRPAYLFGVHSYNNYPGRPFDEVDSELGQHWEKTGRGKSTLSWDHARHAARDSWQRLSDGIERAVPGDSDRDGK